MLNIKKTLFSQADRQRYKKVLLVGYPLLLSSMTFMVMHFCDMKFLANYSSEEMSASMPSACLLGSLCAFFQGLVSYTNVFISQNYGAGRKKVCVDYLWLGAYLSWVFTLFLVIVLPFLGRWLLGLFLPKEVIQYGYQYFLTMLPSQLAILLSTSFSGFYSGRGHTKVVFAVHSSAALLNLLLDWIMILGNWGCPAMGIRGAGIATSIAMWCMAIAMVLYTLFEPDQTVYPTRKLPPINKSMLQKLLRYGTPSALKGSSDFMNWSITVLLIGRLGVVALAASNIAITLANLCNGLNFALGRATEILAGQELGQKRNNEAQGIMYAAWKLAIAYVFLMFIANIIWGADILAIFKPRTGDFSENFHEIASTARRILIIIGIWMFSDTARIVPAALLQAAGDTKAVFIINFFCSWFIGTLCIFLAVMVFHTSVEVAWLFWLLLSVIEGTAITLRMLSGRWRNIKLL